MEKKKLEVEKLRRNLLSGMDFDDGVVTGMRCACPGQQFFGHSSHRSCTSPLSELGIHCAGPASKSLYFGPPTLAKAGPTHPLCLRWVRPYCF